MTHDLSKNKGQSENLVKPKSDTRKEPLKRFKYQQSDENRYHLLTNKFTQVTPRHIYMQSGNRHLNVTQHRRFVCSGLLPCSNFQV